MSRWTPLDLAEVLNRNPYVKLAPESTRTDPKPQSGTTTRSELLTPEPAAKAPQHAPKQDYKAMLVQQCELVGLRMEPEFRFHPQRRFRADWRVHFGMWEGKRPEKLTYFMPSKVLVEYEGGIFSKGKRGHSSIAGIRRDMEKSNLAQLLGYTVIRVAPDHVVNGMALKWIEDALLMKRHVAQ